MQLYIMFLFYFILKCIGMQWFCYKRIIEGEFFSYMNGEVLGARYD